VASKPFSLPSGIVIPGVVEIFSFEPDFCSTAFICEAVGKLEIGWTVHIWIVGSKLFPERGIIDGCDKGLFKFDETVKE
jgi:hypothetical protein